MHHWAALFLYDKVLHCPINSACVAVLYKHSSLPACQVIFSVIRAVGRTYSLELTKYKRFGVCFGPDCYQKYIGYPFNVSLPFVSFFFSSYVH